jgi:hypothetical protein
LILQRYSVKKCGKKQKYSLLPFSWIFT